VQQNGVRIGFSKARHSKDLLFPEGTANMKRGTTHRGDDAQRTFTITGGDVGTWLIAEALTFEWYRHSQKDCFFFIDSLSVFLLIPFLLSLLLSSSSV
jgi:hypothetical protein